jgi:hypothetical protein
MKAKAAALNIQGYEPPPSSPQDDKYALRSDCWPAVEMFMRMIASPADGPVGAVSVEWLFRLYEVTEPRRMLEDLRIMEHAWLEECRKGEG